MENKVKLCVNGTQVERHVPSQRLLRDFLREDLDLTGTKAACDSGMCGSCSIHLDGEVVKSCLVLALDADGSSITTIEGLAAADGTLHPAQQALIDNFGFQCGFCTPGMAMTIAYLVDKGAEVTEEEAKEALVGNICRCTGYTRIINACVAACSSSSGEGS